MATLTAHLPSADRALRRLFSTFWTPYLPQIAVNAVHVGSRVYYHVIARRCHKPLWVIETYLTSTSSIAQMTGWLTEQSARDSRSNGDISSVEVGTERAHCDTGSSLPRAAATMKIPRLEIGADSPRW